MDDTERTRLDALLDLLADEVAKRLEEREEPRRAEPESRQFLSGDVVRESGTSSGPPEQDEPYEGIGPLERDGSDVVDGSPRLDGAYDVGEASRSLHSQDVTPIPCSGEPFVSADPASLPAQEGVVAVASEPTLEPATELAAEPEFEASTPFHAAPLMARLALGVLLILVLINVPLNTQGMALARSIPNTASLVIANGLVVKEATSPDIWVYRDGAFHWITSLDAFEYFKYRWENVHIVETGFLDHFEKGRPIYILLKCSSSPNIYRLEGGQKHWIVDIPTFEAEGHVWTDVKAVPCTYLRGLPDGDSVPPGRGSPPPPLP